MKKISILLLFAGICSQTFAAHKHKSMPKDSAAIADDSIAAVIAAYENYSDSVEKSVTYKHGVIPLADGIGTITIPDGFKYIDGFQAAHILHDLWKNPKDHQTLGLILPESSGVLTDTSFVFNIEYDEIGYVEDKDAGQIDYNEMLKQMQKETEEDNPERIKDGYPAITLVGWAITPYYDKDRKILHWAKELRFSDDSVNTLNYNVRILGRKGVLILNAIAGMAQLKKVEDNLPKVLNIVSFSEGNKYKDFNPSIDKIAEWTIGGLVAGKILAHVGFWALLLKFWKLIVLAFAGGFTTFRKKIAALFKRKKKDDDDNMPSGVIRPADKWRS